MEEAGLQDRRGSDLVRGVDHDTRPQRDGSFSDKQLWRFLYDVQLEPEWRREAELETSYYDNDQLGMQTLLRMKELGIPPVQVNMIAPAIDAVAGWEAISRADLMAAPENEDSYDIAQALNVKLKEALRLTEFNRHVGEAFKTCVKIGVSWLEVRRNRDPFLYPYVVDAVPWREMYWDYRARRADLSDARFIVRARWFDTDELIQAFPRHEDMIQSAPLRDNKAWAGEWEAVFNDDLAHDLANSLGSERRFTLEQDEWRQLARGRRRLFEILYYVPKQVEVLRFRDGFTVELDHGNPLHLQALQAGMASYRTGATQAWRQAWYLGPHRLGDRPIPDNLPHYIPMVAYRKDSNGAPYGLIRRMRSPQEALNARYSRMLYDLSSRKYAVDDDAVDNHQDTAEELNKVNAYLVLRGDRRSESGIQQLPTADTSQMTYQLMQEAKMNIFDVTGLHPEFYGRTAGQAQSGIAIESLIEQTTQVLGVVVDNYRAAKTAAGRLLMAMLVNDLSEEDDYAVDLQEGADGRRRTVVLNAQRADGGRDNDLMMTRMRVALADTPASVTFHQQRFQSLVEIVKSMPPEMQAVMMDLVVRAASLPDSEEILERIRAMTGFGPEPKDPEKRAEMQAAMQQQQETQEMMQRVQMMLAEAELRMKQAKAALDEARAGKVAGPDTGHTEASTLKTLAEANAIPDEQGRKARETDIAAVGAGARLAAEARKETQGLTE